MIITGLYAGLLTLLFLILIYSVIAKRLKFKIGIGDGDNHQLAKAIRVHANFAEHVPLAIILIGLCEYARYNDTIIHALGFSLLLARILHGYGLQKTSVRSWGRSIGVLLTHAVLLIAAILLILRAAQAYI